MKFTNSLRHVFKAAVLLVIPVSLNAATLQDVTFKSLDQGGFQIAMQLDSPIGAPIAYATDNPARIIVDLDGVESLLPQKKYSLQFEGSKNVMFLSDGNKTRVILALDNTQPYEVTRSGSNVMLNVSTGQQGARQSSTRANNEINAVDFQRTVKGEGLIELGLGNASADIDVSRLGSKIIVKFYQTELPDSLDRLLDVVDFATPVTSIDAHQTGQSTTITITTAGEFDYIAYQADDKYVVSVRELTKLEAEEKAEKFAFTGEKMTLNFQDIEVRTVLQIIADMTGMNLVASDSVVGNITLRLDSVPWDQALDIVLRSKGLDKRQSGNVLMVAPSEEIAAYEKQQVEANKQVQELAPLQTEFIRIQYADAQEIFNLFGSNSKGEQQSGAGFARGSENDKEGVSSGGILSPRGSAIVDQRTNTIILTDTEDRINGFKALIERIDIPVRQVLIEARIVIASTDFKKEIGTRWGIVGQGIESFGSQNALFSVTGTQNELVNLLNGEDVVPTAVDLGVTEAAGSITTAILTGGLLLDLELSALQRDGFGEIVSQPKILTGDKQKASIKSGTEIAYQNAASSGATTVEFKEAVLQLDVTPQITPDGRVIMDLLISQDSIGALTSAGEPSIDITQLETQALVGDGQTLVLGGIYQTEEISQTDKVPLLGDIPVIGDLFKRKARTQDKREILIFITPRIVEDELLDR